MPCLRSAFHPSPWLRQGHLQTVLRAVLPPPTLEPGHDETLPLPDGDVLELCWHAPSATAPLAILCHGLEGSADSSYMRSISLTLVKAGWQALTWSYRGCGRQPNRLPRSYHSGATDDLAAVVERASRATSGPLTLVGISLGGNLVLKFLAEASPPPRLHAAVAISAPVDLASCADAVDHHPANGLYRRLFLSSLSRKAAAKARAFPKAVPARDWSAIRSIRVFDDVFTAQLHGFADAADYYARCSALPLLDRLNTPALLLSALDDPLLAPPCFPASLAATHSRLHLESPPHGGHVGFWQSLWPCRSWMEQRVLAFLSEHVGSVA